MELTELAQGLGKHIPPRIADLIYRQAQRLPPLRRRVKQEYAKLLKEIEASSKPYRERFASFRELPQQGRPRQQILADMQTILDEEKQAWSQGYVSGAVYHGDPEHIGFLNQVYALNSQSNPLHADVWPSASKYEAEIISMCARMLGAEAHSPEGESGEAAAEDEIVGSVSSGGTESILLAMKSYRDRARVERGIHKPELVFPVTAHAAFEKACQYFNIKPVRIPVDENFRADVKAAKKAINHNTIALVGSAPSFPHGAIDPIPQLSELAARKGIGFHTDACLGGFVLPWAQKLGYPVPDFDFSLPGVTSMSADTHKYGYAAKGTSVVLYRGTALRHYQYYKTTDWPGGLYFSPTFAGSRPGALSAACWASLVSTGEQGYLDATRDILLAADTIRAGVKAIPELFVLGEPLFVIAFGSQELDIYQVMDAMSARGWSLNGLHKPACVHIAVTRRHSQPGVAERFVADLQAAVSEVKTQPAQEGGMAPIYGLAATVPARSMVGDLLQGYMDVIYKV